MKKELFSSGSIWEEKFGYSRAVKAGNLIFVAGTTATDENSNVMFPCDAYRQTVQIIKKIEAIAKQANISLKKGVYVGVPGPTYETPAEYKMFYRLGGDCVGMSTVPEAIVARHAGMKCVGFSVITDIWRENDTQKISHEMVLEEAAKAEPILRTLLKKLLTVI